MSRAPTEIDRRTGPAASPPACSGRARAGGRAAAADVRERREGVNRYNTQHTQLASGCIMYFRYFIIFCILFYYVLSYPG